MGISTTEKRQWFFVVALYIAAVVFFTGCENGNTIYFSSSPDLFEVRGVVKYPEQEVASEAKSLRCASRDSLFENLRAQLISASGEELSGCAVVDEVGNFKISRIPSGEKYLVVVKDQKGSGIIILQALIDEINASLDTLTVDAESTAISIIAQLSSHFYTEREIKTFAKLDTNWQSLLNKFAIEINKAMEDSLTSNQIGIITRILRDSAICESVEKFIDAIRLKSNSDQKMNISILEPQKNMVFSVNDSIIVVASTTIPVNKVKNVCFFSNGQQLGCVSSQPFSLSCGPLSPGTYLLSVNANLNDGKTVASKHVRITVENLPEKPSSINIVAGDAQNIITWASVKNADYYNLYWSDEPFAETQGISFISVPQSPYLHLFLSNGTTYFYKLAAVNRSGESELSALFFATPAGKLAAPVNVNAEASGTNILLKWDQIILSKEYVVYWGLSSSINKADSNRIVVSAETFIHPNLLEGTRYYYAVACRRGNLESDLSEVVSAQTVPPPPADLVIENLGSSKIITWTGHQSALSYNLYWTGEIASGSADFTKVTNISSPYLHEMPQATFYYLTSENEAGESRKSEILEVAFDERRVIDFGKLISETGAELNTLSMQIRIRNVPAGFTNSAQIKCGSASGSFYTWKPSRFVNSGEGVVMVFGNGLQFETVQTFQSITFALPLPIGAIVEVLDKDKNRIVASAVIK